MIYGQSLVVEKDGAAYCAHYDNFINLMESPAGFGAEVAQAVRALVDASPMRCRKAMWWGWGGPAGTCDADAFGSERNRDGSQSLEFAHCPETARCENHGGPSAAVAVINLLRRDYLSKPIGAP